MRSRPDSDKRAFRSLDSALENRLECVKSPARTDGVQRIAAGVRYVPVAGHDRAARTAELMRYLARKAWFDCAHHEWSESQND